MYRVKALWQEAFLTFILALTVCLHTPLFACDGIPSYVKAPELSGVS